MPIGSGGWLQDAVVWWSHVGSAVVVCYFVNMGSELSGNPQLQLPLQLQIVREGWINY